MQPTPPTVYSPDISNFADLDRSNWITASYSNNTNNIWNIAGAQSKGTMGSADIDIISSGSIFGTTEQDLFAYSFSENPTTLTNTIQNKER